MNDINNFQINPVTINGWTPINWCPAVLITIEPDLPRRYEKEHPVETKCTSCNSCLTPIAHKRVCRFKGCVVEE